MPALNIPTDPDMPNDDDDGTVASVIVNHVEARFRAILHRLSRNRGTRRNNDTLLAARLLALEAPAIVHSIECNLGPLPAEYQRVVHAIIRKTILKVHSYDSRSSLQPDSEFAAQCYVHPLDRPAVFTRAVDSVLLMRREANHGVRAVLGAYRDHHDMLFLRLTQLLNQRSRLSKPVPYSVAHRLMMGSRGMDIPFRRDFGTMYVRQASHLSQASHLRQELVLAAWFPDFIAYLLLSLKQAVSGFQSSESEASSRILVNDIIERVFHWWSNETSTGDWIESMEWGDAVPGLDTPHVRVHVRTG